MFFETTRRRFMSFAGAIFGSVYASRCSSAAPVGQVQLQTSRDVRRSFSLFYGEKGTHEPKYPLLVQTIGGEVPAWRGRFEVIDDPRPHNHLLETVTLHANALVCETDLTETSYRFVVFDRAFQPFAPPRCALSISSTARDLDTVTEAVARYLILDDEPPRKNGLNDLLCLAWPIPGSEATSVVLDFPENDSSSIAALLDRQLRALGKDGFGDECCLIGLSSDADSSSSRRFYDLAKQVRWSGNWEGANLSGTSRSAIVLIAFRNRYSRCSSCPKRG